MPERAYTNWMIRLNSRYEVIERITVEEWLWRFDGQEMEAVCVGQWERERVKCPNV